MSKNTLRNKWKWSQIGDRIIGRSDDDHAGWSVALSGDGSTVAVGSHVCSRKSSSSGGSSGSSARGTCDGNSDGQSETDDKMAKVRMYRMHNHKHNRNSEWSQIGHDIVGQVRGALEGESVAISRDGNIIAIGDPRVPYGDSLTNSVVRVFVYQNTNGDGRNDKGDGSADDGNSEWEWKRLGGDIASDHYYDDFGRSLSISNDGHTLAVASPSGYSYRGYVRIYRYQHQYQHQDQHQHKNHPKDAAEKSWQLLGRGIDGIDPFHRENFGYFVSLSGDGTVVAIGNYVSVNVRVFHLVQKSNTDTDTDASDNNDDLNYDWEQMGEDIIPGDLVGNEKLGSSVALSNDGRTLAIGTFLANYIHVFRLEQMNQNHDINVNDNANANANVTNAYTYAWKQIGNKIEGGGTCGCTTTTATTATRTSTCNEEWFGYSLSLSEDGNTVVVGAPALEGSKCPGRADVYRFTGDGHGDDNDNDNGNDNDIGSGSGSSNAAQDFEWVPLGQELHSYQSNNKPGDLFGWSVSLSHDGNTVAIGAFPDHGRVRVLELVRNHHHHHFLHRYNNVAFYTVWFVSIGAFFLWIFFGARKRRQRQQQQEEEGDDVSGMEHDDVDGSFASLSKAFPNLALELKQMS